MKLTYKELALLNRTIGIALMSGKLSSMKFRNQFTRKLLMKL